VSPATTATISSANTNTIVMVVYVKILSLLQPQILPVLMNLVSKTLTVFLEAACIAILISADVV
jgi:hypothetical protein